MGENVLPELLSVESAVTRILESFRPLPVEHVDLVESLGRVLGADVRASFDAPPFANSSMDGFAVIAQDTQGAEQQQPARLRVVADIPAGTMPTRALLAGEAARIMTGAPLPEGANAVVPVEQTDQNWRSGENHPPSAYVSIYQTVNPGAYVRPRGEDFFTGDTVLPALTPIRPQELGLLAALGSQRVPVIRQPRVVILSTGDELLDVDQPLAPGKIRDANGYTLYGLVKTYGGLPLRLPIIRDTLADARARFQAALALQPDIILSSAGVSVGAFDVVRAVVEELGAINFWRVNLRPGKPLAFGHVGGVPFFGLPGNPVSAMVTFDVFVRPALLRLTEQPDAVPTITAVLEEDTPSDGRRSYLRVKLRRDGATWVATMTGTQSSGALTSMVKADGIIIIPEGVTLARAGEPFAVRLLRDIH